MKRANRIWIVAYLAAWGVMFPSIVASAAAHTATVVALAPRCAEQFRAQPDAAAKIEALGKASSWERSSLVEKSGFAVLPSTKSSDSDIARACSEILLAPPLPEKPKN